MPCLFVVATPLGNLGDLSARAQGVLRQVPLIACEDSRVSGVLLRAYGISTPLLSYHEHNEEKMVPKLLAHLQRGLDLALISDAGTPLISDPGYRLIQACLKASVEIQAVPGPCALINALVLSGLPTHAFSFEGFLPPRSAARRAKLEALKAYPGTLIFYEAPQRLLEFLEDARAVLGNRLACVAREMTKKFEEVRRGTLEALVEAFAGPPPRGEIVVLVAGAPAREGTLSEAQRAVLQALLQGHGVRQACTLLGEAFGLPKKALYEAALILKQDPSP